MVIDVTLSRDDDVVDGVIISGEDTYPKAGNGYLASADYVAMNWLILLGTLLGTVIGTAGTIVSQHLAGRAAEKRERAARAADYRAERRMAIESVLETAHEMERVAGEEPDRASELSHRFWFLHSRLALIGSTELQGPLDAFANAVNNVYWHGTPNGEPI